MMGMFRKPPTNLDKCATPVSRTTIPQHELDVFKRNRPDRRAHPGDLEDSALYTPSRTMVIIKACVVVFAAAGLLFVALVALMGQS